MSARLAAARALLLLLGGCALCCTRRPAPSQGAETQKASGAPLAPGSGSAPPITRLFTDRFDRAGLGPDWFNSGGPYRIERGQLAFEMAHNHPLWLERTLPRDVQIEFDCTALSSAGDVKVELFGDGRAFERDADVARDAQYTATGYVFIFGGWNNRLSTIVKQREHAWQVDATVPRRSDVRVLPGHPYHWKITRTNGASGAHFSWELDGREFLAWDDPQPLDGPGHDRFAFEGWESPARCGDLQIEALANR